MIFFLANGALLHGSASTYARNLTSVHKILVLRIKRQRHTFANCRYATAMLIRLFFSNTDCVILWLLKILNNCKTVHFTLDSRQCVLCFFDFVLRQLYIGQRTWAALCFQSLLMWWLCRKMLDQHEIRLDPVMCSTLLALLKSHKLSQIIKMRAMLQLVLVWILNHFLKSIYYIYY